MAKTRTAEAPIDYTAAIESLKAENATLAAQIASLAPAEDENRFFVLFPLAAIRIKTRIQPEGKPWDDGTRSQRVADVAIQMGNEEGAYIDDINIAMRTYPTGMQRFELQMPSSSRAGGKMHKPFITIAKGTEAERLFEEWKTAVVNRWITEREAAVKAGAPTLATSLRNTGVVVQPGQSDALLTALGIVRNDPKLAPPPVAPAV